MLDKNTFTLEDIINTLKAVGDDERADIFVAELLNIDYNDVWEIEDNWEE